MQFLIGSSSDQIGVKIASWYADQLQKPILTAPYTAICWFRNEKAVACALFNDYNGSSIEFHFYGPGEAKRNVIKWIVSYVFNQLNSNILIAKIPRNHPNLKKILPRLGFKYIAVIPTYFGPDKKDDAILYYMPRDVAAKWVKLNGKLSERAASA